MFRNTRPVAAVSAAALVTSALAASVLVSAPASARGATNLKVTAVRTASTKVQQFGSFKVVDKVSRSGKVPKGLTVELYLSTDAAKGSDDIPLIGLHQVAAGPGKQRSGSKVSVPGPTPAGTYHLLACADPGGRLTESNESDNCRSAATTVKVTAIPQAGPLDTTVQLASSGAKHLNLFRADLDPANGTKAGSATATGADGTTYTLNVPANAAINFLQLTMTPVKSVSGLPGDPRVLGVQIDPGGTGLMVGATLTIKPGSPLSEKKALPAVYDGHGSDVRLTPMTSKPGVFTYPVTTTGGYLLIEGKATAASSAKPVAARKGAGLGLGALFSHTPNDVAAKVAAHISALLAAERQRQLLGVEDDDPDSMSKLLDVVHDGAVQALRAEIQLVSDNPTIGQWSHLLRFLISKEREAQLLGTAEHNGLSDVVQDVLPQVRTVYQKVLDGLHSCDDGMGDVLGLALTRFDTNAIAVFDLPDDPSDACSQYRAAVDFSGTVEDSIPDGHGSYAIRTVWPARSIFDFASPDEGDVTYQSAHYEDVCVTTTGPVTPENPWVLQGHSVDWDGLLQLDKEKYDTEIASAALMYLVVDLGTGVQQVTQTDPDCDAGDTFTWGPGPDRSLPRPSEASLAFSGGELVGSRVLDDERFDMTITAVS